MRRRLILLLLALLPSSLLFAQAGNDCSVYNVQFPVGGPVGLVVADPQAQQHITDNHSDVFTYEGFCLYSGNAVPAGTTKACTVESDSEIISTTPVETGQVLAGYVHIIKDGTIPGYANSNGPAITSTAIASVGVRSCLGGACGLTVTIGGSITYTPDTLLWQKQVPYSTTCGPQNAPVCTAGDFPDNEVCTTWSKTTCSWSGCKRLSNTPIIIDTDGSGFHLTSAAEGVKFDFYGNGHPIQLAWPAQGSTNGWLAIDLNGNGKIDSARELFSNVASQPVDTKDTNAPDGFNDLSQYDSNHDGVINSKDPVWPKLLVWIDSNHDGISQPSELHHLDDVGIHSISTKYSVSPQTDQFGNQFHLKGHLNPDKGDNVARIIYDVYLTAAPPAAQNQETAKK